MVLMEADMTSAFSEEKFNMEVRKFLKKVGVTSQREIEKAVRGGLESGALSGNERLSARVTLAIEALDLTFDIDSEIALS